jgi:hypothetical protein
VRVDLTDNTLSVNVRDLRPDRPLRLIPHGHAPRLLGLHVVSTLAPAWGVTVHPDAKIAWARLPLPGADTQQRRSHSHGTHRPRTTRTTPTTPTTNRTDRGDRPPPQGSEPGERCGRPAIALGEAHAWQIEGPHAEVAERRLGRNSSQSAASLERSATLVGPEPAAQRP